MKKYGVKNSTDIYIWVGMYQTYGIDGLKHMKYTKHTGEFKQSVVECMLENNLTIVETCIKFRLNVSQVCKWKKIYIHQGANALYEPKRKDETPLIDKIQTSNKQEITSGIEKLSKDERIKALEEENYKLRLENECLKKLRALILEK